MNKRILWIAMSLVMIFTNVVNVSASPISDAKNKKKDIITSKTNVIHTNFFIFINLSLFEFCDFFYE